MLVSTADEGTSCWICSSCHNATDPYIAPSKNPPEPLCEKNCPDCNQPTKLDDSVCPAGGTHRIVLSSEKSWEKSLASTPPTKNGGHLLVRN